MENDRKNAHNRMSFDQMMNNSVGHSKYEWNVCKREKIKIIKLTYQIKWTKKIN